MARQFFTPISLNQNELQNARVQNLAAAPSSPVAGQIYYDTALLAQFTWNGATWANADATKLVGAIPNAALTTNPLSRSNHTGTQVSATISDLSSVVQSYHLNQFAVPTANIPMAGFTFTGLPSPTVAGQAAEYSWVIGQVQSAAAGIASKPPARVVTTSNSTQSGLLTVDGVALAAGDRVLCVAQTTATQNGIYIASTGAWTRPTTQGASYEIEEGALWLVTEGTVNAATQWRVSTTGTITVGTTALTIVQFGAGAVYTAGNGLQLTGGAFSVLPVAAGGIVASSSGVAVDTTVVARKFAATIGDGSTLVYTVTHNLGTQNVLIQVKQAASPFGVVEVDLAAPTTNTVTAGFAQAPATGSYVVTVIG